MDTQQLQEAGFSDEEIKDYIEKPKSSLKKVLAKAGEVGLGTLETAGKMAEMPIKFHPFIAAPTMGLRGLGEILPGKLGEKATKIAETIEKPITVVPQTEIGKGAVKNIEWPFKKLDELGERAADYIREKTQPVVGETGATLAGTTAGTAIKFLPYAVGFRHMVKPGFRGEPKPTQGKAVKVSPAGEPIYPPGMKPVMEPLPLTEIQKMKAPVVTAEGRMVGEKPTAGLPFEPKRMEVEGVKPEVKPTEPVISPEVKVGKQVIPKKISEKVIPPGVGKPTSILKSETGAIQIPKEGISRFVNRFREFWAPFSTLPQREQLLTQRSKALGDMARTERIVERAINRTKNLSEQERMQIFETMDGRRDLATLPPEQRAIAQEFITVNDIVGKMLVQRDLISQGAYNAHKGQYIRYAYLKHMLGDETPLPTTPNGKLDLSYAKARKDLTLEQRKALGLIEDVSVAEPLGLAKTLGDVAKYDYLEKLAQDPRNVWIPSIINIADLPKEYVLPMARSQATRLSRITGDTHQTVQLPSGQWGVKNTSTGEMVGKKMGIGELTKETELYRRMQRENPQSPEIKERLDVYERYLEQAKEETRNVPKDFIQMPTSSTWGPMAGTFVRKEIARDLMSFYGRERTNIKGLSKAIDTLVTLDEKATGMFKVAKVPLNIPTMVRNTVSNMIQLNLSGMHMWEIPGYMVKAGQSMLKKDANYQKSLRNGLFKTNWSVTEINEVMNQFRYLQGDSFGKVVNGVRNLAKYYGRIDDFFKHAKFLEQIDKGAPFDKAIREGQKWGMDYSLTDPSIKFLRRHLVPFISYQYKVAPLIVESAVKRPWALGMYAAMPLVLTEMVKEIYKGQMTEDDWKELERQIPKEVTRRRTHTIVPWKINNKWYWFDYSYFLPWGNFLNTASGIAEGDIKSPLTQFGVAGTPMLTLAKTFTSAAMRNEPPKDAFSGFPIYNQLDPPLDRALKTSEYLYNQFAPSMLTRYGALGYMFDIGNEDRYGRKVPAEQAVGKLFGVNIQEANPQLAAIVQKAKINALRDELLRIMMNPKISPEKKEEYTHTFGKEIQNIIGVEPESSTETQGMIDKESEQRVAPQQQREPLETFEVD